MAVHRGSLANGLDVLGLGRSHPASLMDTWVVTAVEIPGVDSLVDPFVPPRFHHLGLDESHPDLEWVR